MNIPIATSTFMDAKEWAKREAELLALIGRKDAQIAALRALAFPGPKMPAWLAWPNCEARFARFLMAHPGQQMSRARVYAAIYWDRVDPPDDDIVIQSHASKLRKKLLRFGITLHSRRYDGYWLDTEGAAKLRGLIADRDPPVAPAPTSPAGVYVGLERGEAGE